VWDLPCSALRCKNSTADFLVGKAVIQLQSFLGMRSANGIERIEASGREV
jgi:hypothetical protein